MKLQTWKDDLQQIWAKAKRDLIFTQATALAYTSLLSLVPLLAVGFFIFHAFGGFESLQAKLQPVIEQNLAPAFSDQISSHIDDFVNNVHANAIGILGVIGFIFTSISTLATIERTFNLIFGTAQNRGWTRRVTTYWSLLTMGPLFLGTSILFSSKALVWLKNDNGFIANMLVLGFGFFPYLVSGILFSMLYLFMPSTSVDKKDALKAGFATGIIFETAKIFYALYAKYSIAQNKIYGSLVVIPVFLLWLYLVWVIVLFGAELCCYFQYRRLKIPYRFNVEERLDPFVVVDIIEALGDHQTGPRGGLTLARLVEILRLPVREVMRHLEFLQTEGWVVASERRFLTGNRFFLAVPSESVDILKIFNQLESNRYIPATARGKEAQIRFNSLWTEWAALTAKKTPRV